MTTELDDENRTVDASAEAEESVPGVTSATPDDRVRFVARVLLEEVGSRTICECGKRAAGVAALRIARRRTGDSLPSLEASSERHDATMAKVARAEDLLRAELDEPADDATIEELAAEVERCRRVLIATARERAGPPRVTEVIRGESAEDAPAVPDDVEPLPPAESAEELKAYFHRLESDLRCARMGFRLYDLVAEAELSAPRGEAGRRDR